MTQENYMKAIEMIAASNSPKVSFNVPVNGNYVHTYAILIHNSNTTLINELVNAGYSLSMCDKGLIVDKY